MTHEEIPPQYLKLFDKYSHVFSKDEDPKYFVFNRINKAYLDNLERCIYERKKSENGDFVDKLMYHGDLMIADLRGSSYLSTRTLLLPFYDEIIRWVKESNQIFQKTDSLRFCAYHMEDNCPNPFQRIRENFSYKLCINAENRELPAVKYEDIKIKLDNFLSRPSINCLLSIKGISFKDWCGVEENKKIFFKHGLVIRGAKLTEQEINFMFPEINK